MFIDSPHNRTFVRRPISVQLTNQNKFLTKDDDILIALQQNKLQECFISEFGKLKGNKEFQFYLGNEAQKPMWIRYHPKPQIPALFRKGHIGAKGFTFDSPLENPQTKRKYCIFDVEEKNGKLTINPKFKPLIINDFLNQPWITKQRNIWTQKDGDLLIKRKKYCIELSVSRAKKVPTDRNIQPAQKIVSVVIVSAIEDKIIEPEASINKKKVRITLFSFFKSIFERISKAVKTIFSFIMLPFFFLNKASPQKKTPKESGVDQPVDVKKSVNNLLVPEKVSQKLEDIDNLDISIQTTEDSENETENEDSYNEFLEFFNT